MFRKNKKYDIPGELIDRWQAVIFANLGVDATTDTAVIKDACRKILLETGKLYANIERIEAGMKPLK